MKAFVWRGSTEAPYYPYSTTSWFMPHPEDPGCIWRGESYSAAQAAAAQANDRANVPPHAFQHPIVRRPIPRLAELDLRVLVAVSALAHDSITWRHRGAIRRLLNEGAITEQHHLTTLGKAWLAVHVLQAGEDVTRAASFLTAPAHAVLKHVIINAITEIRDNEALASGP